MGLASNIIFGGVDLATASPYLQIIDFGVGAVEREISALNPPASDGQIFGRAKNGTRPSYVTLDIMDETIITRAEAIRRLNMILASKEPLTLRFPGMDRKYLMAICTGLPSPSARDWHGDLTINFISHDPYMYSDQDEIDLALTAGGNTNVYVNCSGSIQPTIKQTLTGTLTDPTWTASNGQMIMLQGSIIAGALVIDCAKRTITHSADAAIMEKLSMDSLFFDFASNPVINNAPHVITCANGAAGTLTGKHRWL